MGKSDSFVFKEYYKTLEPYIDSNNSVAFLGFSYENTFTELIKGKVRHFYDKMLNNWEINSDWQLNQKYDLIICTRCAYFSREPAIFIEKCKKHLMPGGHLLVDWGLGDHWRFEKFKVGWVRDGEHEFAYQNDNFLYSCFWNNLLENDENVQNFWKSVKAKNCGYDNEKSLKKIIEEEIPSLVSYETVSLKTLFLWPDDPQLYIITMI